MKIYTTIWLLFSLILANKHALAQDLIIKNDKTELSVRVLEITDDMVKYKPVDRTTGPIYNLRKADIFVIIYQDGSRETFKPALPAASSPTPSAYRESSRSADPSSIQPQTASTDAPINTSVPKSRGSYYGLGYMTASEAFGEVHGYTFEYGYYWLLGQRKVTGILLDCAYMDFFPKEAPTYASIMLNAFFRPSSSSKIYLGSGIGYAQVGIPVIDRYGNSKKTYVGDLGAKAFLGIGSIRATMVWPTFDSEGAGLFTIGFYTNPFR